MRRKKRFIVIRYYQNDINLCPDCARVNTHLYIVLMYNFTPWLHIYNIWFILVLTCYKKQCILKWLQKIHNYIYMYIINCTFESAYCITQNLTKKNFFSYFLVHKEVSKSKWWILLHTTWNTYRIGGDHFDVIQRICKFLYLQSTEWWSMHFYKKNILCHYIYVCLQFKNFVTLVVPIIQNTKTYMYNVFIWSKPPRHDLSC